MICLVCHTQMMKWIWETKMTKKSKWLVTEHSEHKPQEHSQPNRISFRLKCAIKEFLTLNPYRCVGARVWWHRTWLRSSPGSILPVPSSFESLWVRLSSSKVSISLCQKPWIKISTCLGQKIIVKVHFTLWCATC